MADKMLKLIKILNEKYKPGDRIYTNSESSKNLILSQFPDADIKVIKYPKQSNLNSFKTLNNKVLNSAELEHFANQDNRSMLGTMFEKYISQARKMDKVLFVIYNNKEIIENGENK